MKNCRTCKYADWYIVNGRRKFGNWAECTAPVDSSILPASAGEAIRLLEKTRSVACFDNKPVACPMYEKSASNNKARGINEKTN